MYPAFLWPIGIRVFVLSQLSLEIQLERYAKDPSGVILAGALLTILFFIVPLIPFMFMNTYKLTESSQLIQTSLVFRRSRTIELSDIENIEVTEGISGIVPTKNFIMKIKTTKNEMFCIGSKLNGNYDLLSKEIMRVTAQTS